MTAEKQSGKRKNNYLGDASNWHENCKRDGLEQKLNKSLLQN
jgi:hypothetical protein